MDSGETSRKKTNEDETDRPLKKAKYLWQVKGKYHLKDNQATSNTDFSKTETEIEAKSLSIEANKTKTLSIGTKKKNVCNDRSCIEAILANSDKYMEFSLIDSPPTRKNIDKSISDEIPITLVKPNPKTDDYYLRKWQARQIAKGFLDNTINRVLEHWMVAPFDAADFVENCDNGGQIEDEGILMAIQSHGLQSGLRPSLFHCNTRNNWEAQANCTCSSKAPPPASVHHRNRIDERGALTPFHQRATSEHQNLNDFHLNYYEDKPPPPPPAPALSFIHTPEVKRQSTAAAAAPIATKIHDANVNANANSDCSSFDPLKMNDTDFLDAAVAVAIQKKGLTSFNCVDCG